MPGQPGNPGNRRKGAVKGTPSGRRRGQLPWHDDSLILERINLVRTARAQGRNRIQILGLVNEWLQRRGEWPVSLETIRDDVARIRVLQEEERQATAEYEEACRADHVDALKEVQRAAWRAFHEVKDNSLNRSAYLNTIRACEVDIGKFDRSLAERHEVTGNKGGPLIVDFVLDLAEAAD